MRRFSQRSHLVTLSEINITPLLDLAFVLLIIFMITAPILEQGLELSLPEGGREDREMTKDDIRTLEVGRGFYLLDGRRLTNLSQVAGELARARQQNPKLSVLLRADRSTPYEEVFGITEICTELKLGINFRAKPSN